MSDKRSFEAKHFRAQRRRNRKSQNSLICKIREAKEEWKTAVGRTAEVNVETEIASLRERLFWKDLDGKTLAITHATGFPKAVLGLVRLYAPERVYNPSPNILQLAFDRFTNYLNELEWVYRTPWRLFDDAAVELDREAHVDELTCIGEYTRMSTGVSSVVADLIAKYVIGSKIHLPISEAEDGVDPFCSGRWEECDCGWRHQLIAILPYPIRFLN